MKNVIKWFHVILGFKKLTPAELVPFCTANKNALTVDTDVLATGSPVTMALYTTQIADVAAVIASRKTSSSKPLTADEHSKVNVLMNSTESIAHYIEIAANTKYPGDLNAITKIFARMGYSIKQHGARGPHVFEITNTEKGSATLRSPSAGTGAIYHYRWSADQKTWIQLRSTHESEVIISGLPSDTRVYFEVAVTLPAGKGSKQSLQANDTEIEWSSPISELIP